MLNLSSYIAGQWVEGKGTPRQIIDASVGEPVAQYYPTPPSYQEAITFGRSAGADLRSYSLYQRAYMVKALAQILSTHTDDYYKLSSTTGAIRRDSWVDIEGGIGAMFSLSSLVRKQLIDGHQIPQGPVALLSREGSFNGRHILTPLQGVAVQINAYNFPCWGMLEKLASSLIAGVPSIVKPASLTQHLAWRVFSDIIESGILPEGSVQYISSAPGDLLQLLDAQDCVCFTGSSATAGVIRRTDNLIDNNVRLNCETDSLNCIVLDEGISPTDEEFSIFIKEVAREMTAKAGQKCTAVRRIIVPSSVEQATIDALHERLAAVTVGSAHSEQTRMGPLAGLVQRQDVMDRLAELSAEGEFVCGGDLERLQLKDGDPDKGAFFPPTLLRVTDPEHSDRVHAVEAFGPVSSLLSYHSDEERDELVRRGRGSLVCTFCSHDPQRINRFVGHLACWHGRVHILSSSCAKESTGHGSPMPHLMHGGPGRAGGGAELGGALAIEHYMQRTAVQGHPDALTAVTGEYHTGAAQRSTTTHPMSMHFEDLMVGMSLTSHRRTITETDVVNFGCLSGDHFYAHFDEQAAQRSLFGRRVAHGYLLISVAAGLFVWPAEGPVKANYGMNDLRFVNPVYPGDTIYVRLVVKSKHSRSPRPDEDPRCGVVTWSATILNQDDQPCALYDVLTLVALVDSELSELEQATLNIPPSSAH